ncbi:MAG: 1-deoxy-D-xylulose-5-phosphate synthase [bacterium P3]|nr:MAG: 1-deoxy-D-xylulose-5-phosphate synthase [bacterium P3]KWW42028.1 MAG: 1-deoxy-D-xylulose-5-phosphate synthase [bacterium F083]
MMSDGFLLILAVMNMLQHINSPSDLKRLEVSELRSLASELRQYIIDTLATHPGHLASSLGTVELTLVLHYVFNTPDDKLVWDVGHQAYAHKILTGRRDAFPTIRSYGGLSGFPRRDESPYDAFGTGHSSTSISAALGMAMASKLQGDLQRQHIAVIGDGSMTGGEAFEALNNAGVSKANIIVVLNDNGISIDKAVGGLSRYFTRITSSSRYNRLKDRLWATLGGDDVNPHGRRRCRVSFLQRLTFLAKSAALGAPNLFESLGFRYFGPIDGHDVEQMVDVFSKIKNLRGPRLIHVVTKKGRGLDTAERNPVTYHAPGLYDAATGDRLQDKKENAPLKYQDVFGHTIIELAEANPAIVGITPAMPTGCSLNLMMDCMPERTFDVGIAEQHAVTFSAGLAAQGMIPFCNIYSSFMQRAYDQVIHDVALQGLPVVLCLDRAGLVGEDGPTHHGAFDLACLRPVPGLTVCAPMDEHELRNMMYTAQLPGQGPVVIRYPRGLSVHVDWRNPFERIEVGRGRCLRSGADVAILTLGHVGNDAMAAAEKLREEGVSAAVYDMRYLKPFDTELLDRIAAQSYRRIVTVEDGVRKGGFGSAVVEYMSGRHGRSGVIVLGLPDSFVTHGSVSQLKKDCGIDTEAILAACRG